MACGVWCRLVAVCIHAAAMLTNSTPEPIALVTTAKEHIPPSFQHRLFRPAQSSHITPVGRPFGKRSAAHASLRGLGPSVAEQCVPHLKQRSSGLWHCRWCGGAAPDLDLGWGCWYEPGPRPGLTCTTTAGSPGRPGLSCLNWACLGSGAPSGRRAHPWGAGRVCHAQTRPRPNTNALQEKFVLLQHASTRWWGGTFCSIRCKGEKSRSKRSEKQTLTPCKDEYSRSNSQVGVFVGQQGKN